MKIQNMIIRNALTRQIPADPRLTCGSMVQDPDDLQDPWIDPCLPLAYPRSDQADPYRSLTDPGPAHLRSLTVGAFRPRRDQGCDPGSGLRARSRERGSSLIRILFTSSRGLETHKPDDRFTVEQALSDACARFPATEQIQLVHGGSVDPAGKRIGGDWIADAIWCKWAASWPALYAEPEVHPAAAHPDLKARNLYMVALGADLCVAIAHNWISGTGHCARRARKAGIPTLDFGAATGIEHAPWRSAA